MLKVGLLTLLLMSFSADCFARVRPGPNMRLQGIFPPVEQSLTQKIVPNLMAWTSNFTADLKGTPRGTPAYKIVSTTPSGTDWITYIGSYTHTGSSDFFFWAESCSNAIYGDPSYCNIGIEFLPTSVGTQTADFTWPVEQCYWPYDISPHEPLYCYNTSLNIHVTGVGYDLEPEKECKECGSEINVDSQTMIERVPIVGTDFELVYASGMYNNWLIPVNSDFKAHYIPHGFTVSSVHFFDVQRSTLYLGSGGTQQPFYDSFPGSTYRVVSSDGSEVFVFDFFGKHVSTLYSTTGQTKYSFSYNGSKKISQIDDAFGNSVVFGYDLSGNLSSITAPRGQVSTVTVFGGSKLIKDVENPNSEKFEFTYKSGTTLLETFKTPGGKISTFSYDANGKLTQDLGNGGNYWNISKALTSPFEITVSSKMGRSKVVTSSRVGNTSYLRSEVLPTGATKNYSQYWSTNAVQESLDGRITTNQTVNDERFGWLYKRPSVSKLQLGINERTTNFAQTVAYGVGITPGHFNFDSITKTATTNGAVVTSVYTASTKKNVTTTDEGATSNLTIDSYERPVEYQTGSDTPWTLTYGTYGRLDEIVQGTHKKQSLTYNSDGYVSKIKNVRNEETLFSYDLAGRVSQVTLPDSRVIAYSYDSDGNISGITPPNRPQHVFSQNSFDLLATYEPPSIGLGVTKNTTYTYNDDKQLTQVSRPDGQTIDYTYDSTKGRLTQITTPSGNFSYSYDGTTQKLSRIDSPDGVYNVLSYYGDIVSGSQMKRTSDNVLFGETRYNFDANHRVSSRFLRGNPASPTSTISYTYNDDDKPLTVGDLSLSYSYPSGRLSGTTIGRISDSYTYDAYGDLVTYAAVDTGGPTTLYTYTLTRDLGGRISQKVETIQGVTSTYDYSYDSAGRLTSVEKNGVITDSFTYDDNGNRTSGVIDGVSFSATYDNQDRILTYDSRTYTHNNNGDLTRIQWNVTDKTDIAYDVMGNVKQVTLPAGTVLSYQWDGYNRWIGKYSGATFVAGNLYENQYRISASINALAQYVREYVYATNVNVPDYLIMSGLKYRLITDHLGSPRLLVRTDTGTVTQRMDYNTLGLVTADSNPTIHPFGYAGGLWDAQTMTVRFGARTYDPRSTGRWTTKDPVGFSGGDTNLYGYVLNDPINYIDPSGLFGAPAVMMPDRSGPGPDDGQIEPVYPEELFMILPGFRAAKECGWLINHNRYLRIGMGRKGGERVFRITGDLLGGKKIDLFNFGPIK